MPITWPTSISILKFQTRLCKVSSSIFKVYFVICLQGKYVHPFVSSKLEYFKHSPNYNVLKLYVHIHLQIDANVVNRWYVLNNLIEISTFAWTNWLCGFNPKRFFYFLFFYLSSFCIKLLNKQCRFTYMFHENWANWVQILCCNFVVTWKARLKIGIIAWLPLGLHWFSWGGYILVHFLQLIIQFNSPKKGKLKEK